MHQRGLIPKDGSGRSTEALAHGMALPRRRVPR